MGFPMPNHAVVFAEASNRQLCNGALLSHLGASLTIELSASVPCPNPVIADMAADMPKMMLRDPKATFGLIGV